MYHISRTIWCWGLLAALNASMGWSQIPVANECKDGAQGNRPGEQVVVEDTTARISQPVVSSSATVAPPEIVALTPSEAGREGDDTLPPNSDTVQDVSAQSPPQKDLSEVTRAIIGAILSEAAASVRRHDENTGSLNTALAWLVILSGCATTFLLIWFVATHQSRRIKAPLSSDSHTRQALLDSLCQTKEKQSGTGRMARLNKYGELEESTCPKCGDPIKPEWVACLACGASLEVGATRGRDESPRADSRQTFVCPRCGRLCVTHDATGTDRHVVVCNGCHVVFHRACTTKGRYVKPGKTPWFDKYEWVCPVCGYVVAVDWFLWWTGAESWPWNE
jgi:hypothetical protein